MLEEEEIALIAVLCMCMYVYTFLRQAQGIVLAKDRLPQTPRIASPDPQLRYSHSPVTS